MVKEVKTYGELYEAAGEFTKKSESLRLKPYRCSANKLTIGYGRNLEDNGISLVEADMLFANDFTNSVEELNKHYPTFAKLSLIARAVLVDMQYNMGSKRLATMKKFLDAILNGNHADALIEMIDSNWFTQVGRRSKTLFCALYYGITPSELVEQKSDDELDRLFCEALEEFDDEVMPDVVASRGKIPVRYLNLIENTLGYRPSLNYYLEGYSTDGESEN